MKGFYDISSANISKVHHVTSNDKSKWTAIMLVALVSFQCFCIVNRSWYVLHIDVDACPSCGKMITSFGILIENEEPEIRVQQLPVTVQDGALSEVSHDYEKNYTVEGVLHLYVGMWTTEVCLHGFSVCFNPWLSSTKIVFEQTPFISDILGSVYESRPFVLSALIATVTTFLFARFVQISSRSRAVAITVLSSTISGIFSVLSFVIAGIPYMTSVNQSYIRLSPPLALFAILVAGYLSFAIAYRVKSGTSGHKKVLLRHWSAGQL